MRFEGVFECFLPIFDLENTILGLFPGVFKSRSGTRVRGSNFKSQPDIPNCISYCSARWAESNGANIFRIWPSYHKLRLKTVQKRPKNGIFDRKVSCSHLCLGCTSQFFHIIIFKFSSFYSYIKTRNRSSLLDRKNAPKSGRGSSTFWNFEFGPKSYTTFDAPWKTEQLMWRHHMVIYYGMEMCLKN